MRQELRRDLMTGLADSWGYNFSGTISGSYATGNADGDDYVGGLVGQNVGGTISGSYFDSDVSNRPATDPHSKTTSELQSPTSYAGIYADWNVDVDDGLAIGVDDATMPGDATADDPWHFGTGSQYPALRVDFNGDGSATWEEFGSQVRSTLRISGISPLGAQAGATITITGTGFSTSPGNQTDNVVTFLGGDGDADDLSATSVTATSSTSLTVVVPAGAVSGPIQVVVSGSAVVSDAFVVPVLPSDGGDGLIDVTTLAQLDAMRYDLDGDGRPSMSGRAAWTAAFSASVLADDDEVTRDASSGFTGYELMNDLDFADTQWEDPTGGIFSGTRVTGGWAPIGDNSSRFTATFEGNDCTLSNLYINRGSTDYVGLFGYLGSGGEVRNLGLEGGSVTGNNRVGGLVGHNDGTISGSYATGAATGSGNYVGGLVGENGGGTISACYATGNADGSWFVGGLVGYNNRGTISACYATGAATGSGNNVGGLVGASRHKISACYAIGDATGSGNYVGGLVGYNGGTISASYATGDAGGNNNVGGLVGQNVGGTITASYFDSDLSDRPAADSYSKTTSDLQSPTSYTGIYANWNVDVDDGLAIGVDDATMMGDATADDPWHFGTGSQYPALRVDFNGDGSATWEEFGSQVRATLRISGISPSFAQVGATITITGTGFSTSLGDQTDNVVTFLGGAGDADDVSATSVTATSTSLTVVVPAGAVSGPIQVVVLVSTVVSDAFVIPVLPSDGGDGLIDITTLAQLDAMRYDLDGDGRPSASGQAAWEAAFSASVLADDDEATRDASSGFTGYELRANLDFAGTQWEDPTGGTFSGTRVTGGWAPIGDNSTDDNASRFTATFEGNDYTLSNLYINRGSTDYVGLFGYLGSGGGVCNLGLEGGSVTGNNQVGGLVGRNGGTISASYATGAADGSSAVGGLVGWNSSGGTIRGSYATGGATGSSSSVGGLAGYNNNGGTISGSYATGSATGSSTSVGGLVGENYGGTISASYATGAADGVHYVGGLVGYNSNSGTISGSYAVGAATGSGESVGGLVGHNDNSGTISSSYATGNADGDDYVGGLVGYNSNSGTISASYFDSDVSNRPATDPYSKTTSELQSPTSYTGIYEDWNVDVDDGLAIGVDDATMVGDATADDPWDFGTDSEYPALRVDFNGDGTPSAYEFGIQGRPPLRISLLSAPVGATITITGTGFSTSPGNQTDNVVTFLGGDGDADDVSATSVTATSTSLIVVVPAGAVSGPIQVVASGSTVVSDAFVVLVLPSDGGDGLIDITTLAQLDAMRYDLDGDGRPSASGAAVWEAAFSASVLADDDEATRDASSGFIGYELTVDLDFAGTQWEDPTGGTFSGTRVTGGWAPIGDNSTSGAASRFTAMFEGNDYTLSNLYINRPSTDDVGLFGYIGSGSEVCNLGLEGGSVTGNDYVGGLVGRNRGTISASYATGNADGSNQVGGLVGRNGGGTISASYATGAADGSSSVGGLVGRNDGTISASYAAGGATGSSSSVGGLVGLNSSGGTISACYAAGGATGSSSSVGGLVGLNSSGGTISACYATGNADGNYNVGGLVGLNAGTISGSYFDSDLSNRPATDPHSKTTSELQSPTSYTGIYATWNVDVDDGLAIGVDDATMPGDATEDSPWHFGTGSQYPALQVDFNGDGSATWEEFGSQVRFRISGISPLSARVGVAITITGTGFSTSPGDQTDNVVTFLGGDGDADDVSATDVTATSTSLTVVVPAGAVSGPIQVVISGSTVVSDAFVVPVLPSDGGDGLIDVTTLAQLDAMRYDLDGDGRPSASGQAAWAAAFSASVLADDDEATRDASFGFIGYELTVDLDFAGTQWEDPTDGTFSGTHVTGGWAPIGDNSTDDNAASRFTATFEGNDYTLSNLYINRGERRLCRLVWGL